MDLQVDYSVNGQFAFYTYFALESQNSVCLLKAVFYAKVSASH